MVDLLMVETAHSAASEEKVDVPPLGPAYIASVAEREGFQVRIMDLNLGSEGLDRAVEEADLIGVGSYTHNYHQARWVLKIAKHYGKPVVLGGPHATPLYRDALRDGFDYVVRGEGELPILDLLNGKEGALGLAYMEKDRPKANFVSRIGDLDSLPYPARHLLDMERYHFPGAIVTTRGCKSHCIFCSSRNQSGCLRARSVGNIMDELMFIQSLGIDRFFIIDPNFAFSQERALEFCSKVRGLGMDWFTELRLDHMDRPVIEAMAKAGCRVVRFGIESGSQPVVDAIRKGIDLGRLERVIHLFRDNDITPVCGFMIGHPTETREDFEKTLLLARKISSLGGEATFAIQTPYPGTYIYKNAEKLGIHIHTRDWREYHHLNPVMETEHLTMDDLRAMLFQALLEISGTTIPPVEIPDEDAPMIERLADGVERRSFRSICLEA